MKIKFLITTTLFCLLGSFFSNAQTTLLAKGDIAVLKIQGDAPDDFTFITFVDINAGTLIYFTDCGVTSSGNFGSDPAFFPNEPTACSEGASLYTVPSGGLSAGDIISFVGNTDFTAYTDSGMRRAGGGVNLSTGGDQILVFQDGDGPGGLEPGRNPRYIFIAHTSSTTFTGDGSNGSTRSNLPTGLSASTTPRTAVGLGAGAGESDEFDNSVYNGTYDFSSAGSRSAIIAAAKVAMTNPANFLGIDAITDTSYGNAVSNIPNTIFSTPANTTPTNITLSSNSINESATGSNATVGTLSTTDADSGDAHTYSLVLGAGSNNNGSFNISGSALRTSSSLTPGTYGVRINTNDGTDDFSKAFNITVVDNVDPVITVCASIPSNQFANGSCQGVAPNLTGSVTATDSSGTPTITQSPAPGATLGLGTTTIVLTATDGSGNTATCSVNQTVVDNTDPVITVCASTPSDITSNSSGQATVPNLVGNVTATDNCTASPTLTQSPVAGTTISIGTTTITFTATDGSGNTDTCSVVQTVTDGVMPTVNNVLVPANGSYSAGQALTFTVNFNEDVDVDLVGGTPSLSLTIGSTVVQAAYVSGSGTSALTFTYNVQSGLSDADGIAVGTLSLNGGSLADASGNAANLTLNNVGSTTGVLVVVPTSGLQVAVADTEYVIDFDNTVAGINNGAYMGAGLASFPGSGQLNSNGIVVLGLSDGNTTLGGSFTTGDYARGASSVNVSSGGLHGFNVSNGGTIDRSFGVQPGGSDFTPGTVALRLQNRTGAAITSLSVTYEVLTLETNTRNNSFNFGHGADFNTPTVVTDINFNAPTATFSTTKWRRNQFQTNITVNIAAGASYYLVWTGDDNTGSGSRPQIALDDIKVVANPSTVVNTIAGEYESITITGSATAMAGTTVEGSVNVPGGTLTSNGNLTFKSSTTRSAILKEVTGGGSITGDVTVEQFYPANRAFRFVTSPVNMTSSIYDNWQEGGGSTPGLGTHITGGTLAQGYDQNISNNPSLFGYNALGLAGPVGWLAISSNNSNNLGAVNLPVGLPLRMMIRGDRTISLTNAGAAPTATTLRSTGTLAVGDFSPASYVSTFNTSTSGTFAFIGNPYQAQVDLSQTLTSTGTEDINPNFYYAWQPATNNYVTYSFASGGVQNGVSNLIQPGQSFFVITDETAGTTAGYNPDIGFSESQKSLSTFTTSTYSSPTTSDTRVRIALNGINNTSPFDTDYVSATFSSTGDDAITSLDAMKIFGLSEQLSIKKNVSYLSIESRSTIIDDTVMDLSILNMSTGSYNLRISINNLVGFEAFLMDDFLGTSVPLDQNGESVINFDIDGNDAQSFAETRFRIVFHTVTLSSGDSAFAKAVQLYPNPITTDILNITGLQDGKVQVTVTNLLGQQIHSNTIETRGNSAQITGFDNLKSGVYLVSILQEGRSVTKRVVVK